MSSVEALGLVHVAMGRLGLLCAEDQGAGATSQDMVRLAGEKEALRKEKVRPRALCSSRLPWCLTHHALASTRTRTCPPPLSLTPSA